MLGIGAFELKKYQLISFVALFIVLGKQMKIF
jgi:hypothetical protein